jgi:hypothetical protein
VLNKVALSVQINMKADLREIYGAPTRAAAEAAIEGSHDQCQCRAIEKGRQSEVSASRDHRLLQRFCRNATWTAIAGLGGATAAPLISAADRPRPYATKTIPSTTQSNTNRSALTAKAKRAGRSACSC